VEVHPYAWAITVVVMVAILTIDVFIIGRRPHEPSTKEASIAIGFFVGLAVLFGLGVWFVSGGQYAGEAGSPSTASPSTTSSSSSSS
jgi:tellurite resistance protein TerC